MFDTNEPQTPRNRPAPQSSQWMSNFTSTLAAVLLGGLILGFAARTYLMWSVAPALKDAGERMRNASKN
jgi:hypothetical protein